MSDTPEILLVDDRSANRSALGAMLRDRDCVVLEASSGREALEILLERGERVALALVDVQMPEMDGFEVAELMRGTERTRSIPIIFVTASIRDPARVFKGYESGAVDFLSKPLDPFVLRSKVDVFLQLFRQRQELKARVAELELAEERLRQADRNKDEFLAVLSHELRNPLMAMRASLHVLVHDASSEGGRRALEVLDRQCRHLGRMVDDLLDLTRVARGKVELRCVSLDVVQVVRQAIEDHRVPFAQAGIELHAELASSELRVDGDAERIAQVVGNLLGNAMKFTPRGGHAWVSVARDGDEAVVRVRDSGAGIAVELLTAIFAPFHQAPQTIDRSRGGLGLGLGLARSIVEMHGGTIVARSEGAGRGAELEVRLPLDRERRASLGVPTEGSGGQSPLERAAASAPSEPIGGRRVLIVEDNVDNAEMLETALSLGGHDVRVAFDAASALEAARVHRPEVVFCDIGLPGGVDGFELARRLRVSPGLERARLIALSGYASDEDRERALAAGFDEHIRKPPGIDRLLSLLRRS